MGSSLTLLFLKEEERWMFCIHGAPDSTCTRTLSWPVRASSPIYYMLRNNVPYHDLGPDYFDSLGKAKVVNRLVRRLRDLGVEVTIKQEQEEAA